MTDTHTSSSDLTANMREVAVESIEPELDNLWRETNASALASGGPAASRNSVMTLVCYASTQEHARQAFRTIEGLTTAHPSRSVIVTAGPQSGGEPVHAYIGTRTESTGGSMSYAEQILLEAAPDALHHLPGTILPLIVSGLPAFLWWIGEPPWGSEQLEALVDGCDRLIVDSSDMRNPEASLVALDDLLRRKASSCVIGDFNWTRQEPWRELVAQFFDGPDLRSYLGGIDRVSIEYAAGSEDERSNPALAYLFSGWLASRLNWRLRSDHAGHSNGSGAQHQLTDEAGRTVTLELAPRYEMPVKSWLKIDVAPKEKDAKDPKAQIDQQGTGSKGKKTAAFVGPGALMSVHLHARAGNATGTFTVARESDMVHASTFCHVPQSAPPSQTVHLPSLGEAAVLSQQLRLLSHDEVYEDALTMAAQLIGPRARRGIA